MSRKTRAVAAGTHAAAKMGGAHLTREARATTARRLFNFLHGVGFTIEGPVQLAERHIVRYVQDRRSKGVSKRTLKNEAAHIRSLLHAVDRSKAAKSPSISNKALGIAGSSRAGTGVAAPEELAREAIELAATKDDGVAAALALERMFGLRAAEAVRSAPSLATWIKNCSQGQPVVVIFGTKGGKARTVGYADPVAAVGLLTKVASLAKMQGGHIINKPNLRQAMTRYRNVMNRQVTPVVGITGHDLRYAYAHDRLTVHASNGHTDREIYALTSLELGHGDGRGVYVRKVYGKEWEKPEASEGESGCAAGPQERGDAQFDESGQEAAVQVGLPTSPFDPTWTPGARTLPCERPTIYNFRSVPDSYDDEGPDAQSHPSPD